MTDSKDEKIEECGCSKKETPQVPKEAPKIEVVEDKPLDQAKPEEVPAWVKTVMDTVSKIQTDYSSISGNLEALKQKEAELGIREKPLPTAQVSDDMDNPTMTLQKVAEKIGKGYLRDHSLSIELPLDYIKSSLYQTIKTPLGMRESYKSDLGENLGTLKEAVSISGTHAGQDMDTDVAIVPGGISFVPVQQYAKYKQIGQGYDRARFFKTTLPSNGSQTVGSAPTEATQTLTSVEVTPSTITGVLLKVDSDEAENSPFDLTQAVVMASAASYDDFLATDMLDTKSAEGTLTAGSWIRGDTGATVTTSDTASVAMDETGIFVAKQYLDNQGYTRGGQRPVAFLHPKQFRELLSSTNVTSMATNSVPDIWRQYQLNIFGGCEIVVTNAVQAKTTQTNPSYGAIVCMPKHSYGIAVRRNVSVTFHEYGELNQTYVTTNWRAVSGVIDSSSIVRVSTTQ